MNLLNFLPAAVLACCNLNLSAASIVTPITDFSQTSLVSALVPDNDDTGLVNEMIVVMPGLDSILSVEVELEFSGGWNGDLYVLLSHGSGYSVLLNRVGRTNSIFGGAASSGMMVSLSDFAFADVHTDLAMMGSNVSGQFQPDGRESDPLTVVDTDPRTALLSSFEGLDPNGSWFLFVADQAAGEASTLESWSLRITAVPEPGVAFLTVMGTLMLSVRHRK